MSMLSMILPMLGLKPENMPTEDELTGVFERLKNSADKLESIEQKVDAILEKLNNA